MCASVVPTAPRLWWRDPHGTGIGGVSDYTIVFVDTDAGITGLGEVDSVFKRRGALLRRDRRDGAGAPP